jgi:F420-non-reducing hydrogenase iron-sulfur subunit
MTVKRITLVQELLDFIGLGGRVHLAWISSAEAQKFARVVTDFTDHIRAMGPNPLKAFNLTTAGVEKSWPTARTREPDREPVAAVSEQ